METIGWLLSGGLNLVRPAISRNRAPGELIGCMNYEAREEGYRRIDGYERHDGRKAPSDILDDEPGEEGSETEERRAAIGKVPGDELLSVWRYQDLTYAFARDDTTIKMYESSADGWVEIVLGYRVAFTAGTGDAPENGDALATTGTAATIIGHYLTSGSWAGGDAAGVIVFTYDSKARYSSGDMPALSGESTHTITLSAVPAQQTIGTVPTDGVYSFRFINKNFFGQALSERMYGVSGVGNLFEFKGKMFVELETGVETVYPTRIAYHKNHLVVGYQGGSVVYSGTGKPRSFDANDGAGELSIGDILTEFVPGYRDTLFVFGRNKTAYLTGTSNADFVLKTLSDEAGAMANTAALMDEPTVLDDRGVRNVTSTDQFGDFSIATISEAIRPLLDFKRDGGILPIAATRVRRKSQYRLFFDDGDCVVLGLIRSGGRLSVQYTRCAYDRFDDDGAVDVGIMRSICSVEDTDGRERIFFVLRDQRHVFEMDKGNSFDGHPIPYYLRLPYNDFRTPHTIKRYKKMLLEVTSTFESKFSMSADVDDERELGEVGMDHTVSGPTSLWDEAEWSAFYWDVIQRRTAEQRINGRGRNISVSLFSVPDRVEESHVASGITVYYDVRRMQR